MKDKGPKYPITKKLSAWRTIMFGGKRFFNEESFYCESHKRISILFAKIPYCALVHLH